MVHTFEPMPDADHDTDDVDEQTTGRRGFRNRTVPQSQGVLGHLDEDTLDWLADEREGTGPAQAAAAILKMERIRSENPWTWSRLMSWTNQGTRERVRLLRLLVERHPFVQYQDVYDTLDVSERRARTFVKELRDADVVETPGRPAQIRFTDDDTYLVAVEVAAYL